CKRFHRSGFMGPLGFQFSPQPGQRKFPFALNRDLRYAESFGYFGIGEPTKDTEFHNSIFAPIGVIAFEIVSGKWRVIVRCWSKLLRRCLLLTIQVLATRAAVRLSSR